MLELIGLTLIGKSAVGIVWILAAVAYNQYYDKKELTLWKIV